MGPFTVTIRGAGIGLTDRSEEVRGIPGVVAVTLWPCELRDRIEAPRGIPWVVAVTLWACGNIIPFEDCIGCGCMGDGMFGGVIWTLCEVCATVSCTSVDGAPTTC